ncbi:hypothetical protein NLJ89_g8384 [Agrocybe chaxingu]|uniref:Uncharacterized protein n=1 Tax=Agrocybe chaxingu TaxID=84603 RepID=A0A9W8JUS6_9AGAR|nr:hypothetical protein NLJ89_g8384 [Agrocybe chaxingu]
MTVRSPPVSPSARSARKEYFSSATTPKASPQLPPPVTLSRVMSKERGELPVPVTRTRTRTSQRRKSDEKKDQSVPPEQTKHREKKKKEKTPTPREEILELSKGLSEIKSVLGGESGYPTIHQVVLGLDHRTRDDKQALKAVQDKLDLLGDRVASAITSSASAAAATAASNVGFESGAQQALAESNQKLVRAMEEVKARLAVDFPALASKIKEVRDIQDEVRKVAQEKEVVYSSIGASRPSDNNGSKNVDLQPVLDRLEELRKLCEAPAKAGPQEPDNMQTEHMEKILALIQADGNKQVLLSQQQAESVRYLNELNVWLESFVNNGVSQIQGLSTNIEQLCRNLGCDPLTVDGPNGQEDQAPSLLNDIRQLVFGMKARDQNFAALQAAVHSLLEVLSASQDQMGADSRAIAGMIDQQRRDQEMLFRTFTNGSCSRHGSKAAPEHYQSRRNLW